MDSQASLSDTNEAYQNSDRLIYQQFRYLYENYMQLNTSKIAAIYSNDVVFKDPIHEIQGLSRLQDYFAKVSVNLTHCQFVFVDEIVTDECAHITWEMHFQHLKIKANKPTVLRGMSFIRFDEKIIYHEDSYDLGAMLYDNLPILGNMTQWLKRRLAK